MATGRDSLDRRGFLKTVGATGATLSAAGQMLAAKTAAKASGRAIGANDRINIGVIGYGGRGKFVAGQFAGMPRRPMPARSWLSATCTKSASAKART